jgi:hypothetical protein
MNVLKRLWTGIVGAIAGAGLSLLLQIIGQITVGLPIDYLPLILAACAAAGFLIGILVRPRSLKPIPR